MDNLEIDLTVPLRDFPLELELGVSPGSPVALVGPSGSGKTTVLRAIAGLIRPSRGRISIGSSVVFDAAPGIDLPPEQRHVGLVFQNYSLFPHLSVRANVGYGQRRGSRTNVDKLLEQFCISHLAAERPGELSGGERQRVAIARALATEPHALLLDEPTSALDVHTGAKVIGELATTLRGLEIPTLIVSHTYAQAALLAAEIVVLELGAVAQRGTPSELLANPSSPFVARLAGMNVIAGFANREAETGLTTVTLNGGACIRSTTQLPESMPVTVLISPTEITLDTLPPHGSTINVIHGPISSLVPLGHIVRVQVGNLVVELTTESCRRLGLHVGMQAFASFKATSTRLLAGELTGSSLLVLLLLHLVVGVLGL